MRHARAKSILEVMKPWLEAKLAAVSGKSTIAEAIRYALSRWAGLTRYLDDGRIEIDNNVVERAMRPIALGRKNHLFAGSDEGGRHWAVHASLIETAKMNDLDPQAYLADVLAKIPATIPWAKSTNCSPGPTSKQQPSGRWPENSAYVALVVMVVAIAIGSVVASQPSRDDGTTERWEFDRGQGVDGKLPSQGRLGRRASEPSIAFASLVLAVIAPA